MMTASAVAETEYFIADEKEGTMILPPRRRALRPKAKVHIDKQFGTIPTDMI